MKLSSLLNELGIEAEKVLGGFPDIRREDLPNEWYATGGGKALIDAGRSRREIISAFIGWAHAERVRRTGENDAPGCWAAQRRLRPSDRDEDAADDRAASDDVTTGEASSGAALYIRPSEAEEQSRLWKALRVPAEGFAERVLDLLLRRVESGDLSADRARELYRRTIDPDSIEPLRRRRMRAVLAAGLRLKRREVAPVFGLTEDAKLPEPEPIEEEAVSEAVRKADREMATELLQLETALEKLLR